MIRFVFGGAGYGKSEFILNEIGKELENSDKNIYLIVPEQQTVVYETKIAERFPPQSALRLEATNFTRLADAVARRVGGLSYDSLSKGARILVAWRAMLSVWNSLESLSSVSSGAEDKLAPLVYSAIEELKMNSISPEDIENALAEAQEAGETDGSLFQRMRDVSLIYSAYKSITAEEYGAENDVLSRLLRNLKEYDFFGGSVAYIDSFFSVTKEEHKIITEIMKSADDVTISVASPDDGFSGIQFGAVKNYYKSLAAEAARYGEVEIINLEKNIRAKTKELEIIEKYLFDYSTDGETAARLLKDSDKVSNPDSVSVISVEDRFEEAEAVAITVERLVREGAKYSDIAVVANDITKLRGIVDGALRKRSIPCFTAASKKIASSPLTRHIVSLLNIVGSWRRDDVIRLVKTGLSPLDDMESCIFEKYTATWNIRGRRMFESEWSMNPDGYRQEISSVGRKTLLIANTAREKLIPPIEKFSEIFKNGEALVPDICRAIVEYARDANLYGAMLKYADKLSAMGREDDAERERLVWEKFCETFDTMARFLPDVTADSRRFASLLKFALTDADAGAIPTGVDEVALGSAASVRTGEVKHVILLGCVDGEFPGVADEGRFFSESDKLKLEEMGLDLWGRREENSSMELFRFWRSACMGSESLTVMVPSSSFGADCVISGGAARILELARLEKCEKFSDLKIKRGLYHPADVDGAINRAAAREDEAEKRALLRFREEKLGIKSPSAEDSGEAKVSTETAEAIFPLKTRLTQSKLESYVQCPFSYYLKYNLRLKEEKKAEISAPDVGIFIHAVLEEFFISTAGRDYPLPREETEEICDELVKNYIIKTCGESAGDGRLKYLFARLKRGVLVFVESVMREFAQSKFKMYGAELKFGFADENRGDPSRAPRKSLEFKLDDGSVISLYGIVDRMDVYRDGDKTYVRVVDYKTGTKKFSLDDVKIGLNIQLLLYLFSSWKADGNRNFSDGGEILPAGALYFSAKPGDPTSDVPLDEDEAREKMIDSIERSGIVLDDREILEAMDEGISGRYIPVSLKADGTLRQSASLATLEKFGELYKEMEETISRIGSAMKSGDAAARPLERHGSVPCSYCAMKSVCRNSVNL